MELLVAGGFVRNELNLHINVAIGDVGLFF